MTSPDDISTVAHIAMTVPTRNGAQGCTNTRPANEKVEIRPEKFMIEFSVFAYLLASVCPEKNHDEKYA
jgi:hypothetical protein